METTKYIRRPFEVDAVQVTEDNMDDVAKWCRGVIDFEGDKRFVKVRVTKPMNPKQSQAFVGDWVLSTGNSYKVYTDRAFSKTFDQLNGTAKDEATQMAKPQPGEELRTVNEPVGSDVLMQSAG